MSRVPRSLTGAAACLVIGGTAVFGIPLAAAAQAPAGGANTIITAVIAPVRYVVVNKADKITEITSNTAADVTPIVYRARMGTKPIPLTPAVQSQYGALLAGINTHGTGTIYRSPENTGQRARNLVERASLVSYLTLRIR